MKEQQLVGLEWRSYFFDKGLGSILVYLFIMLYNAERTALKVCWRG